MVVEIGNAVNVPVPAPAVSARVPGSYAVAVATEMAITGETENVSIAPSAMGQVEHRAQIAALACKQQWK